MVSPELAPGLHAPSAASAHRAGSSRSRVGGACISPMRAFMRKGARLTLGGRLGRLGQQPELADLAQQPRPSLWLLGPQGGDGRPPRAASKSCSRAARSVCAALVRRARALLPLVRRAVPRLGPEQIAEVDEIAQRVGVSGRIGVLEGGLDGSMRLSARTDVRKNTSGGVWPGVVYAAPRTSSTLTAPTRLSLASCKGVGSGRN